MLPTIHTPNAQSDHEIVEVSPAMAEAWLDKNEHNRAINWTFVAQLARDMRSGQFVCTHQGIAFDSAGRLIDGQHRLWAILEANVTVRMRVFRNEPPENILHIDGNHPRRTADRMTLNNSLGTVRVDELATLRAMLGGHGMSSRRRTVTEEMQLLKEHRTAVRFAHEQLPPTRPAGIAHAVVRAAVARAWYCTKAESRLRRFCEVLRSGVPNGDAERVIVLLRDQLVGLQGLRGNRSGRQRQYGLTCRAISAFLNDERLQILRPANVELFLLPASGNQVA